MENETEPIVAPERRNPLGWLALALMIVLFVSLQTFSAKEAKAGDAPKSWATEQIRLSAGVGARALSPDQAEAAFRDVYRKAEKAEPDDRMATRLRLVVGRLLKEKPRPADLKTLRESQMTFARGQADRRKQTLSPEEEEEVRKRDRADAALADGLAKPKLDRAVADRLAAAIPDEPYVFSLGKAEIREAGGTAGAINATASGKNVRRMAGTAILMSVAIGSFVAWVAFLINRFGDPSAEKKERRKLEFPVVNLTAADADRLAVRAAQVFGLFLFLNLTIGIFLPRSVGGWGTVVLGIGMLVLTPLVFRIPIMGKEVSLSLVGLRGPRVGRLVALGVFGFLLEAPVAVLMGAIGQRIFSFLPEPQHPATTALAESPTLFVILSTLFLAAVVAPYWEEIVFRGLLFPAVSRLTKGPWMGGFLSCLLFAAIHPQGLPLWMALGTVAAFSCALALHTRNLIPSIVLHICHNAVQVVVLVLMT